MKSQDKLKAYLREHPPGEFKFCYCSRCDRSTKHKMIGHAFFEDGSSQWWGWCVNCRTEGSIDKRPKRPGRPPRPVEPGQKVLAA